MVHRTAIIDDDTRIGIGTDIGAFVEIRKGVQIGTECYIDSYCCFTGDSRIGNGVTIRNRCTIARGTEIGDGTFIAPHCMFQNLDSERERKGGAKIGKNCFIGTGVVFKEGVKVCDNVVIGSMSYVNKDITEPGLYFGNPIRQYAKH